MKSFIFPYSVSYGKGDSDGGSFSCSLSDKDAKRLIRSAEEGGRCRLGEDSFIDDISSKVYAALNKELTNQLLRYPDPVIAALSWNNDHDSGEPVWENQIQWYLDRLMVSVFYPEDLQLLEAKKPSKHNKAMYVIMDDNQAKESMKKDNYGNNIIILTDEGRTLYYVPKKFAGSITVPASVRKIRNTFLNGAVEGRKNVTEIIIEEGLTEIDEYYFRNCDGLKRVVIPASVRTIGHLAFARCYSLEEVVLSEGLEELRYSSFEECGKIKSLKLPSTLKLMYKYPVKDLYFMGMNTEIAEELGSDWRRTTLHVLSGSKAEKYAVEHGIKYIVMNDG